MSPVCARVGCNEKTRLQEHHVSYRPEIKIWLCVDCHSEEHPGHGVGRGRGYKLPSMKKREIVINWLSVKVLKYIKNIYSGEGIRFLYEGVLDDGAFISLLLYRRRPIQQVLS